MESALDAVRERLKTISIRGRVAIASRALEIIRPALHVQSQQLTAFIDAIWCFTKSVRLDQCERALREFEPDAVEGWIYLIEPEQLSENERTMFCQICESAVGVATGNLYAGVDGHSDCTLRPLENLLAAMSELGIPFPDLAPFERSQFSEEGGWGNPLDRSLFVVDAE
jgi:hypothetical protein